MTAGIEQSEIDVRGAGGKLDLVRDLLDKQLVDRQRDPIGRVDGIVLTFADGEQPSVASLESGLGVATERVNHLLGRCVRAAGRRWGLREGKPMEIAWRHVARVGIETVLDLNASGTPALRWEHWLSEHVVSWLPSLKPRNEEKPHQQEAEVFPPASGSAARLPHGVQRHHVRLHRILGRQVYDSHGKPAGHLEEAKGRIENGQCVVDEFLLGQGGLLERLSVADLSMVPLRLLGAPHAANGCRVPWLQMDLADPTRPRLRCRVDELRT